MAFLKKDVFWKAATVMLWIDSLQLIFLNRCLSANTNGNPDKKTCLILLVGKA